MDTIAQAKAELRDIDLRIAALQQRKQSLRQFIDIGESLFGEHDKLSGTALSAAGLAQAIGTGQLDVLDALDRRAPRHNTAKARILAACEAYVDLHGPIPTRDLVGLLDADGIEIGGADKVGSLSVMLSKSGLFVADRKTGWSLNRPLKEEPPQGVDAPAGA